MATKFEYCLFKYFFVSWTPVVLLTQLLTTMDALDAKYEFTSEYLHK